MALITVKEAAERKGVTNKAIYWALSEGKLRRHEQYGRVLVDEDELAGYEPIGYRDRPSIRSRRRVKQEGEQ